MISLSYTLVISFCLVGIVCILFAFFLGRILRLADIKKERSDATLRSRSVLLGEVYEKVAPFLPNFPYKPKDMIFLGKGVDYIVFDGLSDGYIEKIIFLELKSGTSTLSKNEKLISEAVLRKKIEFQTMKLEGF